MDTPPFSPNPQNPQPSASTPSWIKPEPITSAPQTPPSLPQKPPAAAPSAYYEPPAPRVNPPTGPMAPSPLQEVREIKKQKQIKKTREVVFYIFGILELLLALRFFFKLFTALSQSPLVQWIFDLSGVFLSPFVGIIGDSGKGKHILEWSVIIAMGMYALLAVIILGLIKLFAPTSPQKVWEE